MVKARQEKALMFFTAAWGLEIGECINFPYAVIYNAAQTNLGSLLFDSVRESDIQDFIKQINRWQGYSLVEIYGQDERVFKLCRKN